MCCCLTIRLRQILCGTKLIVVGGHDTYAEIQRANMEVVSKSYWEMVEEGCSAIEGADLESLSEEDNTVSDRRYRSQMRQFVLGDFRSTTFCSTPPSPISVSSSPPTENLVNDDTGWNTTIHTMRHSARGCTFWLCGRYHPRHSSGDQWRAALALQHRL